MLRPRRRLQHRLSTSRRYWRAHAHQLRWVSTAAIMLVITVLPTFLLGALASSIAQELPFDETHLGSALTLCYFITFISSPLGGHVVARLGVIRSLRLTGGLTSICLAFMAAATSPAHLTVILAIVGIPNALTQPASNQLLAQLHPGRFQAGAFGVVQAAVPLSSLTAGFSIGLTTDLLYWRWLVVLLVVVTLATQLLIPATDLARPTLSPVRTLPSALDKNEPDSPIKSVPIGIIVIVVLSGGLASTAATTLPTFAALSGVAMGIAPWSIAAAQVSGSALSAAVRIGAPLVSATAPLSRHLVVIGGLQLIGAAGILAITTSTWIGYVSGIVIGLAMGWGWNGLFNLVVSLMRPGDISRLTGMTQAGIFLGGTLSPLVFSRLVDAYTYTLAWAAMGTIMCGAASLAFTAAWAARR